MHNKTVKLSYLVILFICLSGDTLAQSKVCEITGVSDSDWKTELTIQLPDTKSGESFRAATNYLTGIKSTEPADGELNGGPYLEIKLENAEIVINILESFKQYEELETSFQISTFVTFTCTSGTRQLAIVHKIIDTNNHKPQFKPDNNYIYTIYTPTGAGTPITSLYGDIIVRDVDLSNYEIDFSIEPNDYLTIAYEKISPNDKKNHYAILKTNKVIMGIEEPLTFKIYAKDVDRTGDDPFIVEATVILKSDPTTQLPIVPVFEKVFYSGIYENGVLTFSSQISLSAGYDGTVHFKLDGENSDLFHLQDSNNIITISTIGDIPNDIIEKKKYFLFSILAEKTDTTGGTAAIYISFPEDEKTLRFELPLYKGEYNNDLLNIEDISLVEGYDEQLTTFTLTGDYDQYFSIENDKNIIKINLLHPINESILEEATHIVLQLEATSKTESTFTIIVIDLPIKASAVLLKFLKSVYDAHYFYKENILEAPTIILEGYDEGVNYKLYGDNSEFFSIKNTGNELNIDIKEKLPENLVDEMSFIPITVEAFGDGFVNATTILTVTLIKAPELFLMFQKNLYTAKYFYENNTLNAPTIILEGYDEGVKFGVHGDNSNFFSIENLGNTVNVNIKETLPESLLDEMSILPVTVEAFGDGFVNATTILTVSLIEANKITLKFQEPLYKATYYFTNESLVIPEIVLKEGYNQDTSFTLSGDYNNYFTISNTANIIQIYNNESLPEELKDRLLIILTLQASRRDATTTFTNIVLSLVSETENLAVLKFEQPLYEGSYFVNNSLYIPLINLTEGYNSAIRFSLSGDMKDYFEIENSESIVNIRIKDILPPNIINEYIYLVLIIEATMHDVPSAITVININLPQTESNQILLFEHPSYIAEYFYSNNSLLLEDITLSKGYNDKTKFTLTGESRDLFDISNEDNKVSISILTKLPEQLLDKYSYVLLTLHAEQLNATSTSTVIIVNLNSEPVIQEQVLKFDKLVYEAIYLYNNNTLSISSPILYEGYDEEVKFVLSGEQRQYFIIENIEEIVKITTSEKLPEALIDESPYIVLILEALRPNSQNTSAVITVQLVDDLDVTSEVIFDTSDYFVNISSTKTGNILKVSAQSKPSLEIEYFFITTDDHLKGKIHIDSKTGQISVSAFIDEGFYDFPVYAKTRTSQENANASVHIAINNTYPDEILNHLNPLIITDIIEEKEYNYIFIGDDTINDECHLNIINTWPVEFKDSFSIIGKRNLSCNSIDRENILIAYMHVSQVQVELLVECTGDYQSNSYCKNVLFTEDENNYNRAKYEDMRWVLTNDIVYSTNTKLVSIVVKDINDNPPKFENSNILIGYPNKELTNIIRPPSLLTVHATDADIGINALIKYTTNSELFTVHPETGVVYPKNVVIQESTDFRVTATDMFGEGNSTDVHITVKLLDTNHITVISVKDELIEDVSDILEIISGKLNYTVKTLTSSVLPTEKITRSLIFKSRFLLTPSQKFNKKDDETSSLKMFIYAFDMNNNIVDSKTINNLLEDNANIEFPWTVESVTFIESDFIGNKHENYSDDNNGLIAAVAVLAIIIILILIGAGVWFFYILPKMYRRLHNSTSSNSSMTESRDSVSSKDHESEDDQTKAKYDNTKNNVDLIAKSELTLPGLGGLGSYSNYKNSNEMERNKRNTEHDEDEFGETNLGGRKKSVVTFNERVRQIDIEEYSEKL